LEVVSAPEKARRDEQAPKETLLGDRPALEATGLWKSYGDRRAVAGVDLVVRAGEVHGLLGPNGAGKTTLMRMLLGLVRPDAGVVRLLGQVAGTANDRLPDRVAGFVDTPHFYPYLSGRRNLRLLSRLDHSAPSESGRVERALDQVGLGAHADVRVSGYSAGMRQRLGLAAALLRSPRLLLLDEPTSSLDPAGARDLSLYIKRLAKGGVAVLFSSHHMGEVEELCSVLTIVHHGRVAYSGTLEDLRAQAPRGGHRLHTSDDERARSIAESQPELELTSAAGGEGLDVTAAAASLDAYVVALGRAGVAIRALEQRDRSLEALFLKLTADSTDAGPPPPLAGKEPRAEPRTGGAAMSLRGVLGVASVELTKLTARWKAWALLTACLVGPFAFAVSAKAQGFVPEDILFGRRVTASGLAVPLVVLGFAAAWAFPALTSVVGGDLFSAEDHHGTWPTLLTRSRAREEVFAGKVLLALAFSFVAVSVLAVSSTAAGIFVIGRQPLLGLSGTLLPPARSVALIAYAWLSVLPPVFAFTMLAVLVSAVTRSSAAGVGLPVMIGFVMQLASYVNGPLLPRRVLLTPPFVAWHGLFTEDRYYGPLIQGTGTSSFYFVVCLALAYVWMLRRDIGN
jgi:ABC-2 type transport system ATP-binding protein